jgi:hypothetical protein
MELGTLPKAQRGKPASDCTEAFSCFVVMCRSRIPASRFAIELHEYRHWTKENAHSVWLSSLSTVRKRPVLAPRGRPPSSINQRARPARDGAVKVSFAYRIAAFTFVNLARSINRSSLCQMNSTQPAPLRRLERLRSGERGRRKGCTCANARSSRLSSGRERGGGGRLLIQGGQGNDAGALLRVWASLLRLTNWMTTHMS